MWSGWISGYSTPSISNDGVKRGNLQSLSEGRLFSSSLIAVEEGRLCRYTITVSVGLVMLMSSSTVLEFVTVCDS